MENLIAGTVAGRDGGAVRVRVGAIELIAAEAPDGAAQVFVGIRGENVTLETGRPGQSSARNHLLGAVKEIVPAGALWRVTLDVGFDLAALLTRQAIDDLRLAPGSSVYAAFKASAVHLIGRG
jgi:molybdopterin-binding protein